MSEESLSKELFALRRDMAEVLSRLWDGVLEDREQFARALEHALEIDLDLPERPDPPALVRLRALSVQRSNAEKLDEILQGIADRKFAALKQSRLPPRRRVDGSRPFDPQGDPWSARAETDRIMAARGQQARRHQEMAQAAPVGWGGDAHASTRDVRAEMYRRWQEQEAS